MTIRMYRNVKVILSFGHINAAVYLEGPAWVYVIGITTLTPNTVVY